MAKNGNGNGNGNGKKNGNGKHTGRKTLGTITEVNVDFARAVRGRKAPRFSADQKRAAVTALLIGDKNGTELALQLGTYPGVIYRWAQDERFGGRAGGLSGRGTGANVPYPAKRKKVVRKAIPKGARKKSSRKK